MGDEIMAAVLDGGSCSWKVGMSDEGRPRGIFPSIVSRPLQSHPNRRIDSYVGHKSLVFREGFKASRLYEGRTVRSWDDMEKAWHHSFYYELGIAPEEHPVMLSDRIQTPRSHREKTTQIMFETFNTPAKHIADAPLLAWHGLAPGATALMVDLGHATTTIYPVIEGYGLAVNGMVLLLGGETMSSVLNNILTNQHGIPLNGFYMQELVRDMKEEVAYVAMDYDTELAKYSSSLHLADLSSTDPHAGSIVYTIPDHGPVSLGVERFKCMEAYFQPHLFDFPEPQSLPEAIISCISSCPIETRRQLFSNIVLTGGGAKVPGLAQRLKKELAAVSTCPVSISLYAQRELATWVGGAFLSQAPSFQQTWTSKEEYDESGPCIVGRRKCF